MNQDSCGTVALRFPDGPDGSLCVDFYDTIEEGEVMGDNPVRLPEHKVDELFRAAIRCVEESLVGGKIDGVQMVKVPEGIFGRLRQIVASCEHDAGDWRP